MLTGVIFRQTRVRTFNTIRLKYIDLGQPKSVAPGPGCSEPD